MGQKKLEQYGEPFLEKIQTVTKGDRASWGAVPRAEADDTLSGKNFSGGFPEDGKASPLKAEKSKGRPEISGGNDGADFVTGSENLTGVRRINEK